MVGFSPPRHRGGVFVYLIKSFDYKDDEEDFKLRGFFFRQGEEGDFDVAVFLEVVVAGELVEGFAAQAQGGGGGKFHVAQGLVDAADVLNFHGGQFSEGLAKEGVAEVTLGVVGRIFDVAPGFDVADEAGVGLEFFFIFHGFSWLLVSFEC